MDFDDDGWSDLLLVASPHPILYRNRGDGKFDDVTAASGLDRLAGEWKGCAVGDYDNDGRLDVVLTGYRCLALLRNTGGSQFKDVTTSAGLDPKNRAHWGSSAGFMDLDGSGRLALVILNYVIFGPNEPQYCTPKEGIKSGCPPSSYRPEYPELWKNLGNGTFREVTRGSGMDYVEGTNNVHGKALVVAFADYDGDGRQDIYIGNDGTLAELLHNEGGLRFKNQGVALGPAFGVYQQAQASMGADWADYDLDGRLDLITTAFSDEPYSLYRNDGAYFENVSVAAGIAAATLKPLGFGAKFLDADNDCWPDIVFANGHVYDNVNLVDSASTFLQPLMLFRNSGRGTFENVSGSSGPAFSKPILGRGTATADFDRDGRVDLVVVNYEGAPLLLRNTTVNANHWLEIELRQSSANRFAYGASVVLKAGGHTYVQGVSPASSYLSSSSPIIHFGLGRVSRIDSAEVKWSDGRRERFNPPAVDRRVRFDQGRAPTTQ